MRLGRCSVAGRVNGWVDSGMEGMVSCNRVLAGIPDSKETNPSPLVEIEQILVC